jgi:transposase
VVQQAVCPDRTSVNCARKVVAALLLQVFYTVRSERLLMEELNYNLLFRWLWD